jgi:hypothetical protein
VVPTRQTDAFGGERVRQLRRSITIDVGSKVAAAAGRRDMSFPSPSVASHRLALPCLAASLASSWESYRVAAHRPIRGVQYALHIHGTD